MLGLDPAKYFCPGTRITKLGMVGSMAQRCSWGYQGTGIGIHTPLKGNNLGIDNRPYNALLTGARSIGERANSLLKQ